MTRLLHPAILVAATALGAVACSRPAEPDAYGNVEATEVVISAETAGRLLRYSVADGATLAAGAIVGEIDPTQLSLEREQLVAQRSAAAARLEETRQRIRGLESQRAAAVAQRDGARAQREALLVQQDVAKRAYDRTNRLIADQAATSQQLDQAEREYKVVTEQIRAQDEQIKAQERQIAAQADQVQAARHEQQMVSHQLESADAQVQQAGERVRKTQVTNPVAGTVLTDYAKAGEFVQAGQPLYRIANLESVEVRAYIGEPQLAQVRLGQSVAVTVDAGQGQRQSLQGSVTWISSQAEFTPTPIQTRDERAGLVYAIKIRMANKDGVLKIGMPVDVQLTPSNGPR